MTSQDNHKPNAHSSGEIGRAAVRRNDREGEKTVVRQGVHGGDCRKTGMLLEEETEAQEIKGAFIALCTPGLQGYDVNSGRAVMFRGKRLEKPVIYVQPEKTQVSETQDATLMKPHSTVNTRGDAERFNLIRALKTTTLNIMLLYGKKDHHWSGVTK